MLCRSNDGGRSWSEPQIIPFQMPGPYEISNPIVVTSDGRLLAVAWVQDYGADTDLKNGYSFSHDAAAPGTVPTRRASRARP